MIRMMKSEELAECVGVIRAAFATVADEFGITAENAPRFTAFATNNERLWWHLEQERRPMYVYCVEDRVVGYYSLALLRDGTIELNNLAVIPEYRHQGIGGKLLLHALEEGKRQNCTALKISASWRKTSVCDVGMKIMGLYIQGRKGSISFRSLVAICRKI